MILVLSVGDESSFLGIIRHFMERTGEFSVDSASSAGEAIAKLKAGRYDAIVSDYQMPGMNGLDLLHRIQAEYHGLPFILFTGKGREDIAIEALNAGAACCLQKEGEPESRFTELSNTILKSCRREAGMVPDRWYQAVFSAAGDAMLVLDKGTGAILDANPAALSLYGYTPEELCGFTYSTLSAGTDTVELVPASLPGSGSVLHHRRKDGTRFPAEVTENVCTYENQTICILTIRDITGRKAAEERFVTANRLYSILSLIDRAIVRTRDLETLLADICRILVEQGNFRMVWIGLVDKEEAIIRPVAHAGHEEGFLTSIRIPLEKTPEGFGPVGSAARTGGYVIAEDSECDPGMEPWREETRKRGYHASAAFPFSLHGEVVGVLSLYTAEEQFFTAQVIAILTRISEDLSLALDRLDEQARSSRAVKVPAVNEDRAQSLSAMLELSSQPFFAGYADGRIMIVNPAFCEILGYADAELQNHSWKVFTPPECAEAEVDTLQELIRTGIPRRYEQDLVKKDGTLVPVEVFSHLVTDTGGNLRFFCSFVTDITGRRQAEREALREQKDGEMREARYRTLFKQSTDAILLIDGAVLDCNPAAESLWGYSRDEILGQDPFGFSPMFQPDGRNSAETASVYLRAARDDDLPVFSWQFLKKDGGVIDAEVSLKTVTLRNGWYLTATIRDVSAQRHVEKTLRERDERLRSVFNAIPDMVWLSDPDLVPVCISPSVTRQCGYTLEELQQISISYRLAPESCMIIRQRMEELLSSPKETQRACPPSVTLELEYYKKDGTTFWSETTLTLIPDTTGKPLRWLCVDRDITERKQSENQVRRLASFPQTNPDPVMEINLNKEITFYNSACITSLKKLGMPEDPHAFLPSGIDNILQIPLSDLSTVTYREVPVGDALFGVFLTRSPGGLAVRIYAHDITASVRMTGALERANRKLNLFTGITRHDIRNRLTGVMGYLELARGSTHDPTLLDYLERSLSAAVGIQHLIDFTKEYENIGGKSPAWQEITPLIGSVGKQFDLGKVSLVSSTAGLSIYADQMLTKVIQHLVDNSLRHGGDTLTRIRIHGSIVPDGFLLVYEDDGAGVPEKNKTTLFNRIVGKKPTAGLFLVREILSLTGITIRENGEPGKGTRFEMMVPKGAYRIVPEAKE
jgi:PAS domain S-box-containing protein